MMNGRKAGWRDRGLARWTMSRRGPLVEAAFWLGLYLWFAITMARGDSNGIGNFQQPHGHSLWAPLILGGAVNAGVMWGHAFWALPELLLAGGRRNYLSRLAVLALAYFAGHLIYQEALAWTLEPGLRALSVAQWTVENAKAAPVVFIFSALYKFARDWARHYGERMRLLDRTASLENELADMRGEIARLRADAMGPGFLRIESNRQIVQVPFGAILYVKSAGNYLEFATAEKTYTAYGAIRDIVGKLPSHLFARAHRSYVVNIDQVSRIAGSEIDIGGQKIPIGASFRRTFREAWVSRGHSAESKRTD